MVDCPDQRVRIEQQFHSMYSLKSSRGSSKCSMDKTVPHSVPNRGTFRGSNGGAADANGLRADRSR